MTQTGVKIIRRARSPTCASARDDKEFRLPEQVWVRPDSERRSKQQQDQPSPNVVRGKGKAHQLTPPPKKRKIV